MSGDTELRILLDPPGMDADIGARFLTRCFGIRWTAAMYRWYLQRSFGGEAPERLIMVDGGRVVAVIALVFRLLRTPDDTVHRVSVLVAGATLPGERGRGCYARILQAALARSALRGCTAALGFVTADNATGRGLLRLGAVGVASAYIASPGVARTHAGRTCPSAPCCAGATSTTWCWACRPARCRWWRPACWPPARRCRRAFTILTSALGRRRCWIGRITCSHSASVPPAGRSSRVSKRPIGCSGSTAIHASARRRSARSPRTRTIAGGNSSCTRPGARILPPRTASVCLHGRDA